METLLGLRKSASVRAINVELFLYYYRDNSLQNYDNTDSIGRSN